MNPERPSHDPYEEARVRIESQLAKVNKDRRLAGDVRDRIEKGTQEPEDAGRIAMLCKDYGVLAETADHLETLRREIDKARELLAHIVAKRGNGTGDV